MGGVGVRESKTLEFKERVTSTFLKTVSAFANYGGGTILFGVDDAGNVVGLDKPDAAALDIENKINDSIDPQPGYTLVVRDDRVVELTVRRGDATPYLYRAKAYRRNGTSTIEVDGVERRRLVLAGSNLSFEGLPSDEQDLAFTVLAKELAEKAGVEDLGRDVLKTLNLYSDAQGYNIAAALLADKNRFSGIDIARFGESEDIILKRAPLVGASILAQLDQAMLIYRDYYCYEQVDGLHRVQLQRIPENAFREVLASALVHRTWDINANIRVMMYEDHITVSSPGGLPAGISEDEYLLDQVSVLRNPILANVFFRLGIIESFGTGVGRVIRSYQSSSTKPVFKITENAITVMLPVAVDDLGLGPDADKLYGLLSKSAPKQMSDLTRESGFGRTKVSKLIGGLAELGAVVIEGTGRGTRYRRS